MSYVLVPIELIKLGISSRACLAYGYFVEKSLREDAFDELHCFVKTKELMEFFNCSANTVRLLYEELIDYGLIKKTATKVTILKEF